MYRIATALSTAAVLLAGAAGANASTTTDYSVTVEGAAHYSQTARPPGGSAEINEGYTFEIKLPRVSFSDGVLDDSAPGTTTVANVDSAAHFEGATGSSDCTGSTAKPGGRNPYAIQGDEPFHVKIVPFGALVFDWQCSGGDVNPGAFT